MIDLKDYLESKYNEFNRIEFISTDPIQIPHRFTIHQDIEISGFMTAIMAWGRRKTIIAKSAELMDLMENKPYEFLMNAGSKEYRRFENFCHRTFNATDALYFLHSLKNIYLNHGGLKGVFEKGFLEYRGAGASISLFRSVFFEMEYPQRTLKHIPDISKGSAAKRINMFLRWMVRSDDRGVDFGLWDKINQAWLSIPLDLHTGITARHLGLLHNKYNNWQAVCELTGELKKMDPSDPVKYDFSLFGLSALKGRGFKL